jgi:hypothetical protein
LEVPITPSSKNSGGILALLKKRGAPATCKAISEFVELDCQEIALEEALQKVIGNEMGTILCCVPDHLAYFESEETRFILERAK